MHVAGFISTLIKRREDAKMIDLDNNGKFKEVITIIRESDYDYVTTPETAVSIIQCFGLTIVRIRHIASNSQ